MRHNCGICVCHTLHDAYDFISSLQHRGREAAGIAFIGKGKIDVIKWVGTVTSFDLKDLYKIFPSTSYQLYIAHVRYATRGRKDKLLEDAHPHVIGGDKYSGHNHEIITNCDAAIVHNGQIDSSSSCDTKALLESFIDGNDSSVFDDYPGSYTMAVADKRENYVSVIRDRAGLRPGVLGFKDGKYVVASEDIALKENGGEFVESLTPGSIYKVYTDGGYKKTNVVAPKKQYCFFEWNYIGHQDSIINGVSVRTIREALGEKLAEEICPHADLVTYLPRCPEISARSFARRADKPFLPVFYKVKSERSFQGSTSEERDISIKNNLHIIPEAKRLIKGKDIIIVDDSIIRGTNIKRACKLVKEHGANKVYFMSYTPPIGVIGEDGVPRGCHFGVDMPPDDNFIVRRGYEDMEKGVEVIYLSRKGMAEAYASVGMPERKLCTFCIGGNHPYEQELVKITE